MIRVLLVDDQPLFVNGLVELLGQQQGIEVVGAVTAAEEALKAVSESKPDVVLMDISMAGMNGIEATRRIVADHPETKVICLSIHSEERFVTSALDAGGSGYLLKDCNLEQLVEALATVAANGSYLSPRVASIVLKTYRQRGNAETGSAFCILTERERAVLQLLAEGRSTLEIASHLHVSVKTVASHRAHAMEKLDIHTVAGLTRYAIREGLASEEP